MSGVWIAAIAVGTLAAATAIWQAEKRGDTVKPDTEETFSGSSNRGFQPALDEAIAAGMKRHAGVSDAMIEWELTKVTGRQGGIAGFSETTVTIRVTSGTPAGPK